MRALIRIRAYLVLLGAALCVPPTLTAQPSCFEYVPSTAVLSTLDLYNGVVGVVAAGDEAYAATSAIHLGVVDISDPQAMSLTRLIS